MVIGFVKNVILRINFVCDSSDMCNINIFKCLNAKFYLICMPFTTQGPMQSIKMNSISAQKHGHWTNKAVYVNKIMYDAIRIFTRINL